MSDLDIARDLLRREGLRLVLARDGEILFVSRKAGIADLMNLAEGDRSLLRGASAADAVTGRASALLLIYGGIARLYSPVISRDALLALQGSGVPVEYDREVEYIRNRSGDGRCPLEELAVGIESPSEALAALSAFVASRAAPNTRSLLGD
jgi:hypothetical protein